VSSLKARPLVERPPTRGMWPNTVLKGSARSWKSFIVSIENAYWNPPVLSCFVS
jgi:hypothetical protein